jgi:hypothetical protein
MDPNIHTDNTKIGNAVCCVAAQRTRERRIVARSALPRSALPSCGFTLNQSVLGKNHGKFTVNHSESNRITPDKREGGAGFTDCGRSAEPALGVTLIPQAPRRLPPAFPNRAQSRQVVVNRGLKKLFPLDRRQNHPCPTGHSPAST